jgi:hypothetical protein
MEPLSITTGVFSLISSITKTTSTIRKFITSYREAGQDLWRISSELSAVRDILENVRDELDGSRYIVSPSVGEIVGGAVRGCEYTVGEIEEIMRVYVAESKRRKIAWAVYAQKNIVTLQRNLEENKSTLMLALNRLNR